MRRRRRESIPAAGGSISPKSRSRWQWPIANLDRRVTLDEFRKTAERRFANYDVDKDGKLTRKELR